MKHFDHDAATLVEVFHRRHHFVASICVFLAQFLDPKEDQASWEEDRRQTAADLLLRHVDGDPNVVRQDIGRFILRDGPYKAEAASAEAYWQQLAITAPRLAKVARKVLSIAPSEAAVERAFSHRKTIHSNIRNSLADASVEALMFVRMNSIPLGVCAA